jgi:hypothetical protein
MKTSSPYIPGDAVLALQVRGRDRYWVPGVVRSVGATGVRVDLGGDVRRVKLERLRLGAAR